MPDERRDPPRRQREAEREPDDDARERDDVRQDLVLEIDCEEDDERRRECQPGQEQPLGPDDEIVQQEEPACQGFDDRVARGNRGAAGRALAAEGQPAQQRHVVVPADLFLAGRAARRRVDDGGAAGQAIDADIEEAADHQPEQRDEPGKGRRGDHGVGPGRFSVGSGRNGDSSPTATVAEYIPSLKGVPAASVGTPRNRPAATIASQV